MSVNRCANLKHPEIDEGAQHADCNDNEGNRQRVAGSDR